MRLEGQPFLPSERASAKWTFDVRGYDIVEWAADDPGACRSVTVTKGKSLLDERPLLSRR